MTKRPDRFDGCTVELRVPDLQQSVDVYSRLFRRRPDFAPHDDFVEWEAASDLWFQLGGGGASSATWTHAAPPWGVTAPIATCGAPVRAGVGVPTVAPCSTNPSSVQGLRGRDACGPLRQT